jgi:hypothetical protein
MKLNRKYHIRRKGTGVGKVRKNPEIGNWKKLEWNNSLSKDGIMWGNKIKGGMVFVSKLSYTEGLNKWRFGGVNARGYFKETYTQTRPQAIALAKAYMRSH